jgi:molybdate transport system substrate-binding protein
MKRRIETGEPLDLAVLVNFQTDELIKTRKLFADTRVDLMKAGIGVAVRRDAPRPGKSNWALWPACSGADGSATRGARVLCV